MPFRSGLTALSPAPAGIIRAPWANIRISGRLDSPCSIKRGDAIGANFARTRRKRERDRTFFFASTSRPRRAPARSAVIPLAVEFQFITTRRVRTRLDLNLLLIRRHVCALLALASLIANTRYLVYRGFVTANFALLSLSLFLSFHHSFPHLSAFGQSDVRDNRVAWLCYRVQRPVIFI